MPHIAIVLLNFNSDAYTKSCVHSLLETKHPDDTYSILVWDNASAIPPTLDAFPGADVVNAKTNDGFARGYNKAMAHAITTYAPDVLLVLNNDTRMKEGTIHALAERCLSAVQPSIVSPIIHFEVGCEFHRSSYDSHAKGNVIWYAGGGVDWANVLPFHRGVDEVNRGQFLPPHDGEGIPVQYVSGCCFAVQPVVWKKLGGFTDDYFMYYEDVDFSIRASKKNIPLILYPDLVMYHSNAGSTSGGGSLFHQYYQTRNRIKFALTHARMRAKIAILRESYRYWLHGTQAQRLGVLHALEGRWGNQSHLIPKA